MFDDFLCVFVLAFRLVYSLATVFVGGQISSRMLDSILILLGWLFNAFTVVLGYSHGKMQKLFLNASKRYRPR